MTISSGDYVIKTLGADGQPCALKVNKTPTNGSYVLKAICADGQAVAVGVDKLTQVDQVGISARCADGHKAAIVGYTSEKVISWELWVSYFRAWDQGDTTFSTCAEALAAPLTNSTDGMQAAYYPYARWFALNLFIPWNRGINTVPGVLLPVDNTPYPGAHNSGTSQASTSTTITLSNDCAEADGAFIGYHVRAQKAGLASQMRKVVAYSSSTKQITIETPWTVTPGVCSYDIVVGYVQASMRSLVLNEATSVPAHGIRRFPGPTYNSVCGACDFLVKGYSAFLWPEKHLYSPFVLVQKTWDELYATGDVVATLNMPSDTVTVINSGQYSSFVILPYPSTFLTCPDYCSTAQGADMFFAYQPIPEFVTT